MADTNWTRVGSAGDANDNANWSANAPDAANRPVFNATYSNQDCNWNISTAVDGINIDDTYAGTISLSTAMIIDSSVAPHFGGVSGTITTNNNDVTIDANAPTYIYMGGIINWGDSTVILSGANTGSCTHNIGNGDWTITDDWRGGTQNINITGDTTFDCKVVGGGIWDMNGASPTISMNRPYNQPIQIDDPGTSTWIWKTASNDSDTWNMGSGSFYNFTVDDTNNNQETATLVGGPDGPLDFPFQIDNNLTISGNTIVATSYTKLLLHCDGEDGDSTFIDDSGRLHTVTRSGDVHTDTTIKKFGTASAQFDGDGDYLTIPANGDWDVGTGNFTFDCWAYLSDSDGAGYLLETRNGSYGNNFSIYHSGLNLVFYSQGTDTISATSALTLDTWHHIALVRDGSDVELFVDGVSVGTGTDANDYQGLAPIIIGSRYTFEHYWTGYMDEIRFSKGTARWTAAFTPETSAYDFVPSMIVGGQVLINDNAAGSSAGKLYVVSGSLKAGDINADTGGTFDAPNGLTFISPIGSNVWRSTGGTINHNNGLVKISNIGGVATNCQVDGNGSNNFYDLEIAMDTGNKVEFTGTPTIIDNNLYVTSGRFQGSAASPYLQVAENTRVSHASGTFAPSGGPVRGTPTRAAILGGESQSSDNTFKDLTIYNSGTMEATTGETIFDGGGIRWQDLNDDAGADETTRFIHNGGTIVASGGACSFGMGT